MLVWIAVCAPNPLPLSPCPTWVTALDFARRHVGYRIAVGRHIAGLVLPRLPPTLDTEIVPGIHLRVDLRQPVARATWWSGRHYEAPTSQILCRWLSTAERFFDIGANYGWFAYLALSYSATEVHAFEPNKSLVDQMTAAKAANGLDMFHPHHIGLSDENADLFLHLIEADTSYSTFGPHPDFYPEDLVQVPGATFDQWRKDFGLDLPSYPAWVAKVDVEGFETKVLSGMRSSLEAHAFAGLVIELNDFTLRYCGTSTTEVRRFLADVGYQEVDHGKRNLNHFYVPA